MSDEPIDDTERREAAALAQALERGSATEELPEDALQTAALLRHSVGGSELRADREEFVLAEVLEVAERLEARRAAEPEPSSVPLWRWLFGLTGAVALSGLLIFLIGRGGAPVLATELPDPSPALLSSGLRRLAPDAEDSDGTFHHAFGGYRDSVYGAISQRYQ